ncbi:MAG: hypothetical protein QHI38_09680 [Armatimonadota bacterium]|nr:hypothetical protein [Armatimonadota bacterium]
MADKARMSIPDVLVLVLSAGGPFDQVSINYTSEIPKSKAQQDVDQLAKETSWPVRNVRITIADTSTPGSRPSTSSVFEVPRLVNTRDGTLILEPFISVLRRFSSIEVDYLITTPFEFRGLEDFESKWVKVNLTRSGNAYRYRVHVKNADFQQLNLPLTEVSNETADQGRRSPSAVRVVIIVLIALVVALTAYYVVSRFQRR